MSFHARHGAGELLARYSFLEPLFEGKRVLELGAAVQTSGASGLMLAERGAAAVLSVEPPGSDLAQALQAGNHPFVQFQDAALEELRPGTFDLVLAWDGDSLAKDPSYVSALARLLSPGGRLVTAIAAGGPALGDLCGEPPAPVVPYETFAESLSSVFPTIEVATQSALVGWVLALGDAAEEPEIGLDGTLSGETAAAAYIAICGAEPCGIAGLTVVALPVAPLAESAAARASRQEQARESAEAELDRATEDRDRLASTRDALEAQRDALLAERDGLLRERDSISVRADELTVARDAIAKTVESERAERLSALRRAESAEAQSAKLSNEVKLVADRAVELERGLERGRVADETRRRELDSLRDDLRRAEEARDRLQSDLSIRREAEVEGEAALRAARSEAQAAKNGVEAALARALSSEIGAAELERALEEKASEAVAQLETVRSEAEEQVSELKEKTALLEEQAAREAGDLREALAAAERKTAEAEEEVAKLRDEVQEARAEMAREAEEEVAKLRDEVQEARADAQIAQRDHAAAQAEAEKWREQAETPPALAEALMAKDEALRERDSATRDRDLAVLEAEQLEGRLRAVEQQRESVSARAEEAARLAAALARAEESLRDASAVRESLEAQVAELAARLESMEERLGALQEAGVEKVEPSPPSRTPQDEEAGALPLETRPTSELEAELAAARGAAEEAQAQTAELEAELQAVRWEKEDIEARLKAAQAAGTVSSAGEVSRLRLELSESQEEIARLRSALDTSRSVRAEEQ